MEEKTAVDPDKSVVELAKERFERCREAYSSTRALAILDTKFVMGDSDNGWQWPDEIMKGRGEDRPCLTVNMTAQHCNQIINNIRQNRPSARILPADNHADKKSAEIIGGLIRNIQVASHADDAHDTAAEHAIYGGEGYWRILTEYESETSFNQCIKIKLIQNPQLVYVDCDAQELDKSDARYGFIFEDVPRKQLEADYPDIDSSSWGNNDARGWCSKDTVRIAEYFYCDKVADTALLLPDGESVLLSQVPEQMREAVEAGAQQKRKTKRTVWKWCKLIGGHDKPVDERDWPGAYLPIVTVAGKEVNVNGEIVRKGVVRDLKDPARMVNYSYSAAIETVALQNKIPYMAAAEAIEGYEDIWGRANMDSRAYLPFNAFDENGTPIPMPARQPPAVMPTAQVQMLQLSAEQMRAASGQQNANFGIKSEAASGVGIQRLKVQGETATFHFPDNLTRGLRYEATILIDLIPKIYDTRRVVRILGLDGKEESATVDPEAQAPYAESKVGKEVERIFNPLLGKYDVVIDTGPSFHTQRQEAAANLTELATRNPALMQVAGDIIVRSMDFPMSEELANRLEKMVPPEVKDQEGEEQQMPPQAIAQMQQMGQQLEQMQAALQEAQQRLQEAESKQADVQIKGAEVEVKRQEAEIKAFDAETKRMQVMLQAQQAQQQAEQAELAVIRSDPVSQEQPEAVEEDMTPVMLEQLAQGIAAGQQQVIEAVTSVAEAVQSSQAQTAEAMQAVIAAVSKPKRVKLIRDESGRATEAVSTIEGD